MRRYWIAVKSGFCTIHLEALNLFISGFICAVKLQEIQTNLKSALRRSQKWPNHTTDDHNCSRSVIFDVEEEWMIRFEYLFLF